MPPDQLLLSALLLYRLCNDYIAHGIEYAKNPVLIVSIAQGIIH